MDSVGIRLHRGCGRLTAAGWINSGLKEGSGIDIACDILEGLPLDGASIDEEESFYVEAFK